MKVGAVIVAAGKGRRMGAGINKVYLEFSGKSVLEHTVSVFENCDIIDEIAIVTDDLEMCSDKLKGCNKVKKIILGGQTRQQSVQNGLDSIDCDIVAIHDGARALVTETEVVSAIENAEKYGAAAVGVKSKDTLKKVDDNGFIIETVDREFIYNIQTPQVFSLCEIKKAYQEANGEFTDDCGLFESFGKKVKMVDGSYENIKITTPEDLILAQNILEKRKNK